MKINSQLSETTNTHKATCIVANRPEWPGQSRIFEVCPCPYWLGRLSGNGSLILDQYQEMFILLNRTTYHSLSQLSADYYQALQL